METEARILVVDDTKANLDVLDELLNGEGYTVSLAPNGEIALRIASRVVPDLILLDVMMPGLNGFEVCERLKADPATRDVPVIFCTAENEIDSVVKGFDVGGIDYIKKPFQDREVLARVDTHLQIDRLTRDLAERNRELSVANQRIQEANARKSAFVANLSHELRAPVTSIIGFANLVERAESDRLSSKSAANLKRIAIAGKRMSDMVDELLDLSKIESGKMDVELDAFRLSDLVEDCCAEIEPLAAAGVTIVRDGAAVVEIETDRSKLRQILTNLLSNAAKFTEQGSIEVSTSTGDGQVEIVVRDTGIGISAEDLGSIFEEFEQASNSQGKKGTGLGLSITRALTHLLGGSIAVESEEGTGTTFSVRIPQAVTCVAESVS